MLKILTSLGRSPWYWLFFILLGLAMESIALFYQYGLEYSPCVLCIHVRIWVAGMILTALAGLLLRNSWLPRTLSLLVMTAIMVGMLERSWLLFGTERGTITGSCDMESGLPAWFALDAWFPAIFKVRDACGYSPELLFGITMAEALLVMSAALLLLSLSMTIASILKR